MSLYDLTTTSSDEEIIDALPPLWRACLRKLCERGSTRCNDGGMVDDIASSLCSKPDCDNPLARWEMNPGRHEDGYLSRYTPTERGRHINSKMDARPFQLRAPQDASA